ncbi:MAG: tyrosine-type recombinase/integrase [Verrucomicrobia bacterium]|nr:tyrosine-type recombinase/integrase [Verrucomicrobiota bacterium]
MTSNPFPILIERFFTDHLRTQRNVSPLTIEAYSDTFRILLRYLAENHRQTIDRLTFRDFGADDILAFLDHLERVRGNCVRSRNARLAAIRAFAHFALAYSGPAFAVASQRILAIPCKRTTKPVLSFMNREEVMAVLAAIDTTTKVGRRDHLFFSLLYQTGARISEASQLGPSDVRDRFLRLHGKGRKERAVPIPNDLMARLHEHVRTNKLSPDRPLFANRQGAALTREGLALRLDLAVHKAEQTCPSLRGRRITPHTWRHSTAMHLLQAGVPLEVIALWLGHEQPAVTHTYVQADLKMKRECMKLLEPPSKPRRKRDPLRFSRLLSFLEAQ